MKKLRSVFIWAAVAAAAFCLLGFVPGASGSPSAKKDEAAALITEWNREAVRKAANLLGSAADELIAKHEFKEAASSLREAAKAFLILNETGPAEATLRRSIELDSRVGNAEGLAETSAYLTLTLLRTNDAEQARSFADEAVRYGESSGSLRAKALSSFVEAEIAYRSRNLELMTGLQERALHLYRQAGDKYGEAEVLTYLSYTYTMNNRRHDGLEAAEAAVALLRETPNRRGLTFALIAAGDASGRLGRWSYAYRVLSEARSYFPEALDQNENAMLNDRLAVYFETYGDPEQALEHYRKALALFEEIGDPIGTSELCSVIAELESKAGNIEVALDYVARSSALAKASRDPISMGMAEESWGQLLLQKGAYDEAADRFQTAIRYYERIGMNQLIAASYNRLGNIRRLGGDLKDARKFFGNALDLADKIESGSIRAESLFHLADLEFAESDAAAALRLVEESLELTAKLYDESALSNLRIKFNSVHRERHDLKVKVLMDLSRRSNDITYLKNSLVASEALRSRVLRENFILADALVDADPAELRTLQSIGKKLGESSDKLTDALSKGSDKADIVKLELETSDLQHELEGYRAKLREKSPRYSALKDPPPFDITDFQNTVLDDDSLLLEYFLGDIESYLWIVGRDQIEAFVLPGREPIEKAVDEVLAALNARKSLPGETADVARKRSADSDLAYPAAARRLSDIILGPVSGKLAGKRLIIVPDGKLHYVAMSALPMPGMNDEPLLLSNEVVSQPSAQTYALLKKNGQDRKEVAAKDLLIFSDPVFNLADDRLTSIERAPELAAEKSGEQNRFRLVESFSSLSRLPGSRTEGETVSRTVGGSDTFMGFDATRERLLSTDLADYRVVHLATHGFLDPERPELSSLIFSRYNKAGTQIDESVRLQDIYSMKLKADLVVLSACQTGTGKEVKGEGVMGLDTAFLQSGARSVVSTLWQVEDNAANELMKEFYERMVSDGMSPSAALRSAQIKLYQDPQFRSPFFWAAFTVHGDASSAIPFKREHTKLAIGISAALLLGLIGFMVLRRRYRTSKA